MALNHRCKYNFSMVKRGILISKNLSNQKLLFDPAKDTERLMDSYEAESVKTREVRLMIFKIHFSSNECVLKKLLDINGTLHLHAFTRYGQHNTKDFRGLQLLDESAGWKIRSHQRRHVSYLRCHNHVSYISIDKKDSNSWFCFPSGWTTWSMIRIYEGIIQRASEFTEPKEFGWLRTQPYSLP